MSAKVFDLLESSLSTERMATYLTEAAGNKSLATALYFWNCQLAESLQTPLHFLEVVIRNAMHGSLKGPFGDDWYDNASVGLTSTLQDMVAKAKLLISGYGKTVTTPDVISTVTFGFWVYLLTNRYETSLWRPFLRHAFPYASRPLRKEIHDKLDQIRLFRNRIAHHEPIFNKNPDEIHKDIVEIIGWTIADLDRVVMYNSTFPALWTKRPDPCLY